MTAKTFRFERIEKLLHELRYEVTRGVMEGDLLPDVEIGFRFMVPIPGENDVLAVGFQTRKVDPRTVPPIYR